MTPQRLAGRWAQEATEVGLAVGDGLDRVLCWGDPDLSAPGWDELTAALIDDEVGLCARDARFTEADVVEHLCAVSGGRLTAEEITGLAARFLASDLVVRLTPTEEGGRRRPAEWSTAAHRGLEDEVVGLIDHLSARPAVPVAGELVDSALAADGRLGDDQVDAVRRASAAASSGGGGAAGRRGCAEKQPPIAISRW